MTLHTALSIFLIGVSGCSLANQFALDETLDNVTPHARKMPSKIFKPDRFYPFHCIWS